MAELKEQEQKEKVETAVEAEVKAVDTVEGAAPEPAAAPVAGRRERGRRGERGGRRGGPRTGRPERKSEFDQRIINIRRVARVVAGGRRFSFSVAVIIGNKKGKVGVGLGKAGDTTLAIDKAVRNAKKNLITV
ncbi:MAG: 30S ribosomal protein S5, partial [Patescibacteria group bacterium]|nr:30S ribosomal protein S5 [Patescibacteria group bacterium]